MLLFLCVGGRGWGRVVFSAEGVLLWQHIGLALARLCVFKHATQRKRNQSKFIHCNSEIKSVCLTQHDIWNAAVSNHDDNYSLHNKTVNSKHLIGNPWWPFSYSLWKCATHSCTLLIVSSQTENAADDLLSEYLWANLDPAFVFLHTMTDPKRKKHQEHMGYFPLVWTNPNCQSETVALQLFEDIILQPLKSHALALSPPVAFTADSLLAP